MTLQHPVGGEGSSDRWAPGFGGPADPLGHIGHGHETPTALDCSEAMLRVFEYLDGEMEAGDHAKIRAHLDLCADCLRQYDLDQMVKLVVKRSCAPEVAPLSLRAMIISRLAVIRVDPTS